MSINDMYQSDTERLAVKSVMAKTKDKNGYIRIIAQNHPKAFFGKVHEHILVMEAYLGRHLPGGTIVHHINRKRSDNRIENLLLLRNEDDHLAIHRAMDSGNSAIVEAYTDWSRDFMAKLKSGLPEKDCYAGDDTTTDSQFSNFHQIKTVFRDNNENLSRIGSHLHNMLFDELKKVRKRLADENNVPAYIIFHDKTLVLISQEMPTSEIKLHQISGVGPAKLRQFGSTIIEVVKKFKYENGVANREQIELQNKKRDPA